MSALEIISKERWVENMIAHITNNSESDTLHDLAQDVYLTLLSKPKKTQQLYDKGELKYYIARILMNNIASNTSPYYRTYIMPLELQDPIPQEDNDDE